MRLIIIKGGIDHHKKAGLTITKGDLRFLMWAIVMFPGTVNTFSLAFDMAGVQ